METEVNTDTLQIFNSVADILSMTTNSKRGLHFILPTVILALHSTPALCGSCPIPELANSIQFLSKRYTHAQKKETLWIRKSGISEAQADPLVRKIMAASALVAATGGIYAGIDPAVGLLIGTLGESAGGGAVASSGLVTSTLSGIGMIITMKKAYDIADSIGDTPAEKPSPLNQEIERFKQLADGIQKVEIAPANSAQHPGVPDEYSASPKHQDQIVVSTKVLEEAIQEIFSEFDRSHARMDELERGEKKREPHSIFGRLLHWTSVARQRAQVAKDNRALYTAERQLAGNLESNLKMLCLKMSREDPSPRDAGK